MSDNKSTIPYAYHAIPHELMEDEFIDDPLMMRIIREIFKRIRKTSHTERINTNKTWHNIDLQPDQFIYGRQAWAEKFKTTDAKIRIRINRLIELKYVERCAQNLASGIASGSDQNVASGYAMGYSILRFCVEAFYNKNEITDDQRYDQRYDQRFDKENSHKERSEISERTLRNKKGVIGDVNISEKITSPLHSPLLYNGFFKDKSDLSTKYNPDWAKKVNLGRTQLDQLVWKYQIPEKDIRGWMAKCSVEKITTLIKILDEEEDNNFIIILKNYANSPDNVCYVVFPQQITTLAEFIQARKEAIKWIQKGLTTEWGQHRVNKYHNRQKIPPLIEKFGLTKSFKWNKDSCVDTDDGKDYHYSMNPDEIYTILERKLKDKTGWNGQNIIHEGKDYTYSDLKRLVNEALV